MSRGPWKKRNLMVEDALRDPGDPEIDVTEEEGAALTVMPQTVIPVVVTPVASPVVVAPSAPITMTRDDLQAMITAAVTASAAGNAALADAVTQGIANAREPIPENKIGPGISEANPLGDREHPRPHLRCKMTFGTQDAKTKILHETYPLVDEDLTVREIIALNTLEPVHADCQRLDGAKMKVSIIPEIDPVNDTLAKLTIVVPTDVTAKGSQVKNMLPGVLNLVQQITGRDFSRLAGDDLAWFMAEHRAGRYVTERVAVAA